MKEEDDSFQDISQQSSLSKILSFQRQIKDDEATNQKQDKISIKTCRVEEWISLTVLEQQIQNANIKLPSFKDLQWQNHFLQQAANFLCQQHFLYGCADSLCRDDMKYEIHSYEFKVDKPVSVYEIENMIEKKARIFKEELNTNPDITEISMILEQKIIKSLKDIKALNEDLTKRVTKKIQLPLPCSQTINKQYDLARKECTSIQNQLKIRLIGLKFHLRLLKQKHHQLKISKPQNKLSSLKNQDSSKTNTLNRLKSLFNIWGSKEAKDVPKTQKKIQNEKKTQIEYAQSTCPQVIDLTEEIIVFLQIYLLFIQHIIRHKKPTKPTQLPSITNVFQLLSYSVVVIKKLSLYMQQECLVMVQHEDSISFLLTIQQVRTVIEYFQKMQSIKNIHDFRKYLNIQQSTLNQLLQLPNQTTDIIKLFIKHYEKKNSQNSNQINVNPLQRIKQNNRQKQLMIKSLIDSIIAFNFLKIATKFPKKSFTKFNHLIKKVKHQPQHRPSLQFQEFQQLSQAQEQSFNPKLTQKVQYFWSAYLDPEYLKRQFFDYTSNFQYKSLVRQQQKFNFLTIYTVYSDTNWIAQKVRYFIHMSQYFGELMNTMSLSTTQSMTQLFNVVRFLMTLFVGEIWIQSVIKIEQQILQNHGQYELNTLKMIRQKNDRWKDVKQTIIKILDQTVKRLSKYYQEMVQNPKKVKNQKLTNTDKLSLLIQSNPSIKAYLQQTFKKTIQQVMFSTYNFDRVKYCYQNLLQLCLTQYSTKNMLKKILQKRVLKLQVSQVKQALKSTNFKIKQQHVMKFIGKNSKNISLENILFDKYGFYECQQYQFICQNFMCYFLEMTKVLTTILTLPFYSFQNEVENIKGKHLQKSKYTKSDSVLFQLDTLYIIDGKRFNFNFLTYTLNDSSAHKFFQNYLDKCISVYKLFTKNNMRNKLIQIPEPVPNIALFKYPKYIHQDRLSIFSVAECEQLFFQLIYQSNFDQKAKEEFGNFSDFSKFVEDFKEGGREMLVTLTTSQYGVNEGKKSKNRMQEINEIQEIEYEKQKSSPNTNSPLKQPKKESMKQKA